MMIVEAVKSFLMPQRVIQMHRAAARDHKHIRDAGCEKLFCYIIRKFLFHFDFLLKIPCQVVILYHTYFFFHSRHGIFPTPYIFLMLSCISPISFL